MTKATVQGLMGRKLRTALTAIAIVLGVAMVSGTLVLTDTMRKAFDGLFEGTYEGTSAVISGKEIVQGASSGNSTVPESLLPKVQELSGVEVASGAIFDVSGTTDLAKLIDRNGDEIGTGQQPTFGWGIDPTEERFNPLELTRGDWAGGSNEVVIDAGTAKNENYSVGDKIGVSAEGPTQQFNITGIAKFGSVDSIGGSTFAVFDVPTAQAVLKKEGEFDTIFVAAKPDVSDEAVADQIRPLLPSSAEVQTGAQQGEADAEETNEGLAFITYFLLAFAAIALIVGSFVIFNTLSMTVAQRVRELATLRTLGASRKQVFRSVVLEGFLTGLFAALVGLFVGFLIAKGLNALFKSFGVDLPSAGTVFSIRTVIVSLLVGIGITLLATISPARRATRVPPIAAVREGATLPTGRFAGSPVTATVVLAVAAVALAIGLIPDGLATGLVLLLVGVGCLLLFIGVGLISSRLVRPLAAWLGAPGERIAGTPGRLARENATRNPTRTARTAGALMIGLALVTLVATLGASLKGTNRGALEDQVRSDYVVTSKNGFDPITSSAGNALADVPGVAAASAVRDDMASSFGSDITVTGVDPSTIGHVYDYRWEKGSDTILLSLGFDGAIVRNAFADDNDLKVGDSFRITTPQGKKVPLVVRGIYDPPAEELDALLGNVTLAQRAFDTHFPRPKDLFVFVDTNEGDTSQATAALEKALDPYPDAVLRTTPDWVDERAGAIDTILNIFYVLLALSIVVSLFGMVNALALSVFERTRELGMLRAIGLTRRQTRRMVRWESVITALIGAALGLPLGALLAAIIVRALRSLDVTFSLPVVTIVVFALVAILAGTLAAIGPARRASRLNVLRALQYE
jgi:putative ABC transport system permease protein